LVCAGWPGVEERKLSQGLGIRVLVAEDDPISRRILETRLKKWQFEVLAASDGNEASQILRSDNPPRLVVLDWMMPGKDGIQLCRELRKRSDAPYTYVIMLTARGEREDVIQGLDAGADDYICKPFDAQELRVRLRAGSRIVELQDELIRAREELREQATRDSLTGVLNRGAILGFLRGEIARGLRENSLCSIVMVDLDHFKSINDKYGHPTGDDVLKTAAHVMSSSIRPYDAIGRYGGEEFLLVLPGARPDGAVNQAERMRGKVAAAPIATPSGTIHVTASVGVCGWTPDASVGTEGLLQAADHALYRAKRAGRNRVELATETDLWAVTEPGEEIETSGRSVDSGFEVLAR
jgi:diguanylate cyclase (GGDEF)-like protein